MDLSVVVPIYNEEESVKPLCDRLHAALRQTGKSFELILVDDGSSDGTWQQLLAAQTPHMRLIRLRRNCGQTAALSAGFDAATGDFVITMDADLQNDPDDIPLLLSRMSDKVDVVSGWRKDRKDTFINRRLPSIIANALISRITGVRLHDYGCALKAYRREIVKDIELYGEMHRFIVALASWVGGRVDEVVVRHHPRQFGKSKYGISRTIRVILDLIVVKFLLKYSTKPIQVFGRIGLTCGAIGVAALAFIMLANAFYHVFHTTFCSELIKRPFWVVTPFMLIFFGVQFVSMGLLAELQTRTYHESQGKPIYVIRETVEPPAA